MAKATRKRELSPCARKKLDSERGRVYRRWPLPCLAELDGDVPADKPSVGEFGEVHPELFADDATRQRLGLERVEV